MELVAYIITKTHLILSFVVSHACNIIFRWMLWECSYLKLWGFAVSLDIYIPFIAALGCIIHLI